MQNIHFTCRAQISIAIRQFSHCAHSIFSYPYAFALYALKCIRVYYNSTQYSTLCILLVLECFTPPLLRRAVPAAARLQTLHSAQCSMQCSTMLKNQ